MQYFIMIIMREEEVDHERLSKLVRTLHSSSQISLSNIIVRSIINNVLQVIRYSISICNPLTMPHNTPK